MKNIFSNPATLLASMLLLTVAIYWPGLKGTFLFDDFPQIVINQNLDGLSSLNDVMRVVTSGNAGPGGRGIALLTFAAQKSWFGLHAFDFKLFNLLLHLVNALLLFGLVKLLLSAHPQDSLAQSSASRWLKYLPLIIAAWWVLNPMALTGVLYVVQRMTSLSAMFSLLGLSIYVHFRLKHIRTGSGNITAFVALTLFTALSYYSKENGILTFALGYLVEAFILRWQSLGSILGIRVQRIGKWLPLPALIAAAVYFVYFSHLLEGYGGRPFTLTERTLTQTRVLWFYISQILVPNLTWFSLYHDDFALSKSLLTPATTSLAIAGHLLVIIAIYLARQKTPMLALGLAWFYVGHSLESTIFPLEMVYEHRNYLPMAGLLFAAASVPIYCANWFRKYPSAYWILIAAMLGSAGATAARATSWGDPMYPVAQAERHPASPRANFDAGIALLFTMKANPHLQSDLQEQTKTYFDRSIAANGESISPFVGIINLYMLEKKPIPDAYIMRLVKKLEQEPIHANVVFSVKMLNDLLFENTPYFTDIEAERIYRAILNKPGVSQLTKAHTMMAYAFLWGKRGDQQQQLHYMKSATEQAPHINEFRIIYTAELVGRGIFDEAKKQIAILKISDPFGIFHEEVETMSSVVNAKLP